MEMAEDTRDETVFFAARDAARFAAGHIGLEELVPDVQTMTTTDFAAAGALGMVDEESDTILLSRKDFDRLLARIERLEQWTGLRRKASPGSAVPGTLPANADMSDMMKQNEACRYLSCGKNTIKGYASRGLIHSYRQGKFTYYSRKELDKKIQKAERGGTAMKDHTPRLYTPDLCFRQTEAPFRTFCGIGGQRDRICDYQDRLMAGITALKPIEYRPSAG